MVETTPILIWLMGVMAAAPAAALTALILVIAAALAMAAIARAHGARPDARACGPAAASLDSPGGAGATRVLIVGAGARGREVARALLRHPELRREIIGFVDDEPGMPSFDGIPILGATRDIGSLVTSHAPDEIIVAHAPSWQEMLINQLVAAGQEERVRVTRALGMRDAMAPGLRLRHIADIPLVAVNTKRPGAAFYVAKRMFDIGFSLAALTISAPVIALLALLVKATSRGPAFFCQRRVGLRGREFTIYKLRTMMVDAERDTGPKLADPYDERVTPLGRVLRITRLDELPQFVNVLRGEMSVVGPRPERPEFTREFIEKVPGYAKRLTVKPGITGLAQVRGGYDSDVHTKLKHDWVYVYHQSLWLDLRIMLSTVRVLLLCAGQ
jgi:exopolysaccharide biosynthesis polyprenyl glycosylphosphotransferase